jgi:hypothetical protein
MLDPKIKRLNLGKSVTPELRGTKTVKQDNKRIK